MLNGSSITLILCLDRLNFHVVKLLGHWFNCHFPLIGSIFGWDILKLITWKHCIYLREGEERGCDDDGDEELEYASLRGPGVVHGAVVVDWVVDGDVALEGDRHRQEDGAGQGDPVQRVQELGRAREGKETLVIQGDIHMNNR